MSFVSRTLCLLSLFVIAIQYAAASSAPPRPLKRIAHPTTRALEILPRRPSASGIYAKRSLPLSSPVLEHTDTFRLTLSAFSQTFHLHLRPNDHLIHPAARITFYSTAPDGRKISHTEPLLRENVKAYWGEVVGADASQTRMREDAVGVQPRPSGGRHELGWARITVHDQGDATAGRPPSFEGAFSVKGDVHHVMTLDNYVRNKHALDPHVAFVDNPDAELVIFRDSDVMTAHEFNGQPPAHTCAHDRMDWNVNPLVNPALQRPLSLPTSPWYDPLGFLQPHIGGNHSLARRDDVAGGDMGSNFEDNIGESAGCPTTQKVVYVGVAADCVYTNTYGSTQNATQQIITNFNTASALYKSTFNVSLGIIELQVQDPTCPTTTNASVPWNVACQDSVTLNDRLSLFSEWRGQKGNDGAGLWHLMSGCPTGTEVGIAWLATLCQQTASGSPGSIVSGTAVSTSGRTEWQVVAHEIGHNFGAIHDCAPGCDSGNSTVVCCPLSKDSCNANSQFIMSPVAESTEQKFSACTLGNICSLMLGNSGGKTNTSCLIDATDAQKTISLGMCGNGIVEDGEECDPGQGVTSSCCNASTCKLNTGAVCDPSNSACCTDQCAFSPSTQVCRPAQDPNCDQAEMCTGTSATCPADSFSPNGQSCGSNGLACASGVCTSLDKQCQTVGASMNLTTACPSQNDKTCQVTCEDPGSSNQCIVLQSQLVDGSPCGYGGTCNKGTCQAGSFLDTAKAWYRQNLQISIPVTVVVGIIVLLILFALARYFLRCCRRSRPKGSLYETGISGKQGQQRLSSWPNGIPVMTQAGPSYPTTYGPNAPQYAAGSHGRGRSDGWAVPISPSTAAHRPTRSVGSNQFVPQYRP